MASSGKSIDYYDLRGVARMLFLFRRSSLRIAKRPSSSSTRGLTDSTRFYGFWLLGRPIDLSLGATASRKVLKKVSGETFLLAREVSRKAFMASIKPFCSRESISH